VPISAELPHTFLQKINLLFSLFDLHCIVFLSEMFLQTLVVRCLSLYVSPHSFIGGRDDVVSVATRYGWTVGGSNSGGERESTCHPDRLRNPPNLCFNVYQFFREGKQADVWYGKLVLGCEWVAAIFLSSCCACVGMYRVTFTFIFVCRYQRGLFGFVIVELKAIDLRRKAKIPTFAERFSNPRLQ
jgi:hypothetical protein